jgi:hypothetical protein
MKNYTIYKTDCCEDKETFFCSLHTTKENLFEILRGLNNNPYNYLYHYK